jgi:hypothetical protein
MMSDQKTAKVIDMLAPEGGVRTHTIVAKFAADGRTPSLLKNYPLSADVDKAVEMPLEHAMQFLKDASFKVFAEDGTLITPLPINKDGGIGGMKLEPGETVAHLTELTTTALLKRCKANPYSTSITQDSSREAMIEFLMSDAVANVGAGQQIEVAAQFAAAGEQMSAADLNRTLGAPPMFS